MAWKRSSVRSRSGPPINQQLAVNCSSPEGAEAFGSRVAASFRRPLHLHLASAERQHECKYQGSSGCSRGARVPAPPSHLRPSLAGWLPVSDGSCASRSACPRCLPVAVPVECSSLTTIRAERLLAVAPDRREEKVCIRFIQRLCPPLQKCIQYERVERNRTPGAFRLRVAELVADARTQDVDFQR